MNTVIRYYRASVMLIYSKLKVSSCFIFIVVRVLPSLSNVASKCAINVKHELGSKHVSADQRRLAVPFYWHWRYQPVLGSLLG